MTLNNESITKIRRADLPVDQASRLLQQVCSADTYSPALAESLVTLGREEIAGPRSQWRFRCWAVLLLETHAQLALSPNDQQHLCTLLDLPTAAAANLLGRLNRRRWLHERLRSRPAETLARYLRMLDTPCKLSLARYLFSAEDVARHIRSRVQLSGGRALPLAPAGSSTAEEAAAHRGALPDYEARILEEILTSHSPSQSHHQSTYKSNHPSNYQSNHQSNYQPNYQSGRTVFWVDHGTDRHINACVEHPLTTAALVFKAPGSDLEIEIKRCGKLRQDAQPHEAGAGDPPRPLGVVYQRDGRPIVEAHRLDGGSCKSALYWEAAGSARMSTLYRSLHGEELSISRVVAINAVTTLPGPRGQVYLVDYLTQKAAFGEGFEQMRSELAECVAAFIQERKRVPVDLPGDLGLTTQFLQMVPVAQGVISNTSSLRLDSTARYLRRDGLQRYRDELSPFQEIQEEALGVWLAEEVLEEALGVLTPPGDSYPGNGEAIYGDNIYGDNIYGDYVEAIFAVEQNRQRADRAYLHAMRQLGTFWGTLLALGITSHGESLVDRNIGLKSSWRDGHWQVELIFCDHDHLLAPSLREENLQPKSLLAGTIKDAVALLGGVYRTEPRVGSVERLEEIYRIEPLAAACGRRDFTDAANQAYRHGYENLSDDGLLADLISSPLRRRLRRWHETIQDYLHFSANLPSLAAGRDAENDALPDWRRRAQQRLQHSGSEHSGGESSGSEPSGVEPESAQEWIDTLVEYRHFLHRFRAILRLSPGEVQ